MPDPARLELRETLACRRQLVDEITGRKQQLKHLTSPAVRARVEQALAFLRQEATALLALLRARIAADAVLAALMRKMLVTLNAMLKAKTSWQVPRQK